MTMRKSLLALLAIGAPAAAQTAATPAVIRVVGHGLVRTPPDVATVSFTVRGEGATSDDAVRALITKRTAIDAAFAGKAQIRTGKLSVMAARDKACDAGDDEGDGKPRLSSGACAVRGFIAILDATARVTAVAEAGTLLGLASRLGATDPSLEDFDMVHPATAQRAAVADAVRDAREQAGAIATASHVALGRLRRVEDQRAGGGGGEDIVVTAQRVAPAPPPPIAIALSPEPIQTRADLVVEFDVAGPLP